MALYDRELSLTKAVIYFQDKRPQTFYSYLRSDKRGKEFGVAALIKLIEKAKSFKTAIIYDNQKTIADQKTGEIKNAEIHKFINNVQIY